MRGKVPSIKMRDSDRVRADPGILLSAPGCGFAVWGSDFMSSAHTAKPAPKPGGYKGGRPTRPSKKRPTPENREGAGSEFNFGNRLVGSRPKA